MRFLPLLGTTASLLGTVLSNEANPTQHSLSCSGVKSKRYWEDTVANFEAIRRPTVAFYNGEPIDVMLYKEAPGRENLTGVQGSLLDNIATEARKFNEFNLIFRDHFYVALDTRGNTEPIFGAQINLGDDFTPFSRAELRNRTLMDEHSGDTWNGTLRTDTSVACPDGQPGCSYDSILPVSITGPVRELMSRERYGFPKKLFPGIITAPSPPTDDDDGDEPSMKSQTVSILTYEFDWHPSWTATELEDGTVVLSEPGRVIEEPRGVYDLGDGVERVVGHAVRFRSLGEIEPDYTNQVVSGRVSSNSRGV